MAYTNSKGVTYYLHSRKVVSGAWLHYFSRNIADAVPLPVGYVVTETKTGLPVLRKVGA